VMAETMWWQAEPIWKTLQGFGLTSGVVFWPGSEASGIEPNEFVTYDGDLDNHKRLKLVEAWLSKHDFVATYISSLDKTGHKHGPDSIEMNKELTKVDALVGGLLGRIPLDTNVIIVSDHGMAQVKHRLLIDDVLPDWQRQLKWVDYGPVASLIPQEGLIDNVYEELRDRLFAMKVPVQVYKPENIPGKFRFRDSERIAPITLICQHGWTFDKHRNHGIPLGAHGYDPEHPSMHSMFIARGPSFKQHSQSHSIPEKAFDPVSNLDLYPLMCYLLQIECLKGHHGSEALSQHVLAHRCNRSRIPNIFQSS
jgi:predicted AlkP superfamily pyrophosphatase or phosphodiesterase